MHTQAAAAAGANKSVMEGLRDQWRSILLVQAECARQEEQVCGSGCGCGCGCGGVGVGVGGGGGGSCVGERGCECGCDGDFV